MKPTRLLLSLAAMAGLALPSLADDHDHEDDRDGLHRRTKAEIRAFFENKFPEALEHLAELEAEGEEEEVEELWQEGAEFVGEYYLLQEELGPEAANHFLGFHRAEIQADHLTEEFHESEGEEDRNQVRGELEETLRSLVEHRIALEELELERARRELEEAAREIEEIASNLDEFVAEELEERLFGEEGDDEEDDDEDDDDDDDDGDDDEDDDEDE